MHSFYSEIWKESRTAAMECTRNNQASQHIPNCAQWFHFNTSILTCDDDPPVALLFFPCFSPPHSHPRRNRFTSFPIGDPGYSPSSENRCQARDGPRALLPRDRRAYLGPRDITLRIILRIWTWKTTTMGPLQNILGFEPFFWLVEKPNDVAYKIV